MTDQFRFAICFLLCMPAVGSAQLRIVSYNTTPTNNDGLAAVFEAIGEEAVNGIARPIDILALQEQPSQAVETQDVVDILNRIYGPGVYGRGNVNGDGFFTQGVVFNTQTVELISEQRIGTTSIQGAPRQTLQYQFRPVGYDESADFYIYNSHLKANNNEIDAARRNVEATAIRRHADGLGDGATVIFLGDFNLYQDSETAFQTFIGAGNAQAFDPVNQIGRWSNNGRYSSVHTQSTTVQDGENRAGGGVNDRFDFQLLTGEMMDGEGLSYIGLDVSNLSMQPTAHSYRAFGNNGTHFRSRNISTGTGASPDVLKALETASDHLPIVVDYQVPAILEASLEYPRRVIVDSEATGTVRISNVAPVQHAIGADELDYSVLSLSSVSISAAGSALALAEPTSHRFQLSTNQIGNKTGTIVIVNQSPQSPPHPAENPIEFDVLHHASPSLASETDLDATQLFIDGTDQEPGSWLPFSFDLYNRASVPEFTANLQVHEISPNAQVEIDEAPTTIVAGELGTVRGRMLFSEPGQSAIPVSISTSDEDLPGAHEFSPLTLTLSLRGAVPLRGDFDNDGLISANDIDQLSLAIRSGTNDVQFDLNSDKILNEDDRTIWIASLANTFAGDANLDGEFNSSDLVSVFQADEYRDDVVGQSTWASGDWDGDAEFDTSDLVYAFQQGGFEAGPRVIITVPEPKHSMSLFSICFWMIVVNGRSGRRKRSAIYSPITFTRTRLLRCPSNSP